MRDCLFFVADKNIESIILGFLNRPNFHLRLGCKPFAFNAKLDLKVAHGKNDPGLFTMANELLQPYFKSHRRVVVILDAQWSGSPGAQKIKVKIEQHCLNAGWSSDSFCAVVIDPELENWIWQDNAHVPVALGLTDTFKNLKARLEAHQMWVFGEPKPSKPKNAVEFVLRENRIPRSSALYKNLAEKMTLRGCTDSALLHLIQTLRMWF